VRSPRLAGASKYPLRKMIRFAVDGILSFSSAPLKAALRVGLILSLLSIAFGVVAVVLKLMGAYEVPGWTSVMVAVVFLGGVQLLTMGLMGEYISRIHDEVRARPLYLVREVTSTPGVDASRVDDGAEAAVPGVDDHTTS
jgi:dolichol-phosphate mannosyltransferase